MLIVFGGLPGSGKTTIARLVARGADAAYLRIDVIEQALRDAAGPTDLAAAGYDVAYRLAESNLALGRNVVADSVNPIAFTREAWRAVARRAGSGLLQVEITCSDAAEHRRRVEGRRSDIAGLKLPDWSEVLAREYEPWEDAELIIDTATTSPKEAAASILSALR